MCVCVCVCVCVGVAILVDQLIYNFLLECKWLECKWLTMLLVSGIQQSDSMTYIHVSILFQILFPFRLFHNIDQSSLCYIEGSCLVQSLSRVWLFVTPWIAECQASLPFTTSWNLLKLMSIESVMPSYHLILSSPSPPDFNLSQHQGQEWVNSSHQVAKLLELQHQSF